MKGGLIGCPLLGSIYEGTSNMQLNTIAKIVSAQYR